MSADLSPIDKAKFVAAKRAVDFVESGMRLGLGTGSTAAWMVRCLAGRIQEEGLKVVGVPTSTRTAELARQLGVPIMSLDEAKWLEIIRRTWSKMSKNAQAFALSGQIRLPEPLVPLITKAIS